MNLILKLSIKIISSKIRRNNLQIGFWKKTLGRNIAYLSGHIVDYQPQEDEPVWVWGIKIGAPGVALQGQSTFSR